MNADELYEAMKHFLRTADLSFHEKDKVRVTVEEGVIIFSYSKDGFAFRFAVDPKDYLDDENDRT
jgi:hypothetical protein